MKRITLTILSMFWLSNLLLAQYDPGDLKKSFQVKKYNEGIKVDGVLDEEQWLNAQAFSYYKIKNKIYPLQNKNNY